MHPRVIAQKFRVCVRQVRRIHHKYITTGSVDDLPRSGRPRVSSPLQDRGLITKSLRNRRLTAPELCGKWQKEGVVASLSTVKNRLRAAGLHGRVSRKIPLLTPTHKQKRLAWALKYRNWTVDDWAKVLFSDEKIFRTFNQGRTFIRRKVKEELPDSYQRRCVAHGAKLMVWASISVNGPGPSRVVDGNLNGEQYVQILGETMFPAAAATVQSDSWIFQQDNAPSHTSKKATTWFKKNGVQVLDWPPNSPDLNPIENVWAIVQHRMLKSSPSTPEELHHLFDQEFNALSPEVLRSVIDSLPERIETVIKKEGGHSGY